MNQNEGLRRTSRVTFCGWSHGTQACVMALSVSMHAVFNYANVIL
jgi:hypothetical protein